MKKSKPLFLRKSYEISMEEKERYLRKKYPKNIIDKMHGNDFIIYKAFSSHRLHNRVYGGCMIYLVCLLIFSLFDVDNLVGNIITIFTAIMIPILLVYLSKALDLQDEVDHVILYGENDNSKNITNETIDVLNGRNDMSDKSDCTTKKYIGKGKNRIRK